MKKNTGLFLSAAGMILLILDSRASTAAAAQAVEICIRTVIPSLFPFFLLSGYLTSSFRGGKWIARLFRMEENCGVVIVTGLLSGYPVGAKTAAEGYREGILTRQQANRLLLFISQAGPSFLFGMVAAQFDGLKFTCALWFIQLFSALSVANFLPGQECTPLPINKNKKKAADPMHSALKAMGAVCGWVVIFTIFTNFLKRWLFFRLQKEVQILFCGLLELTSGCLMLKEIDNISLRFLLASVMLNFGGVCVLLQTASVSSGLKIKNYIQGKILQTGFAVLYTFIFLGMWQALIPVGIMFLTKRMFIPPKRCSISMKYRV